MVHRSARDEFIGLFIKTIREFFGDDPRRSPDYARIINERHFARVVSLMSDGDIIHGGGTSPGERYIEPTLIANVRPEHRVMQEEIFGPLFPVLEYDSIDEAVAFVNSMPRPLAMYYFTRGPQARGLFARVHSGGACVNDTFHTWEATTCPSAGSARAAWAPSRQVRLRTRSLTGAASSCAPTLSTCRCATRPTGIRFRCSKSFSGCSARIYSTPEKCFDCIGSVGRCWRQTETRTPR